MANAGYSIYKTALLTAAANVSLDQNTTADGPYVGLIDTAVHGSFDDSDDFWNDVAGVVGAADGYRITTPTVGVVAAGVFDGDNITAAAVTGATVEALIVYRHNAGANTTWRLVFFEDTGVTGLPVTPNGGDIIISWSASGIWKPSDRRLKDNVREAGNLYGILPIYQFTYNGSERWQLGLMAHEVERVAAHAVAECNGYKIVNYAAAVAACAWLALA